MRTGTWSTSLAVATVAVLAFTGCSGSKAGEADVKAPSADPAKQVSTTPLPKEKVFKGKWDGAVGDVKISSCGQDAGEQVAKLTVKNSAKKARDYQIMVMWMLKDDGKPYGAAMTTVKKLEPGKEKALEVKAKVAIKTEKCVLNVKAGTLA